MILHPLIRHERCEIILITYHHTVKAKNVIAFGFGFISEADEKERADVLRVTDPDIIETLRVTWWGHRFAYDLPEGLDVHPSDVNTVLVVLPYAYA